MTRRRGPGEDRRTDEIIKLAARGLNNTRIAEELGIKPSTVKAYWERIYKDIGQNTQAAAVATYTERKFQQLIQELEEKNAELSAKKDMQIGTLSQLLADANGRLAEMEGNTENWGYIDAAMCINRSAVYELKSLTPPTYKYFSPSGKSFGLDVPSLFHSNASIVTLAHPDDLPVIIQKSAGATYYPNERYMFIYRFGMPEPRWSLDSHQAVYNEQGKVTGILGVIMDIHDLVTEGILPPRVEHLVITTEPPLHPS